MNADLGNRPAQPPARPRPGGVPPPPPPKDKPPVRPAKPAKAYALLAVGGGLLFGATGGLMLLAAVIR